ncbi:L,D-transpeptidase family protein [Parvimonas micra]|uniref:L,D-transpeptidase family protein n=1 Tax=Parvimonas micra TaxID=33033 RepID=UPI000693652F|nr:L,D-transpeptidase family protein [Parvimonas micra]
MKKKFLSTTFLILSLLMINVLIFNKYTDKSIVVAESFNGWKEEGNERYFFQNSKKFTGEYQNKYFVNGKYANGVYNGTLYKNGDISTNAYVGEIFYGSDGKPANGWYDDGSNWYFFQNGKKHNGYGVDGNGKRYFVNGKYANGYVGGIFYSKGKPVNGWYDDGKDWYFFRDGKKYTGKAKDENGEMYFVKGKYANTYIDGVFYKDGKIANWWCDDGKDWYFFQNGKKHNGYGVDANGRRYFISGKYANAYVDEIFYSEGKIANWWINDGEAWYFFQNGKKHNGYGIDANGKRYFVDGKYANGIYGGKLYKDGIESKGRTYVNGIFYDENISPADGWYDDGDAWYFFKDGKKYTGKAVDGNGEMYFVKGKYANAYIDGIFYSEGKIANWWYDDGSNWYFFKDGKKYTGKAVDGNGEMYFIGGKYAHTYINGIFYGAGKIANGWYDDGDDWYFFQGGKKHTGYATDENGQRYFVNGKYANGRYGGKLYKEGLESDGNTYINGIFYSGDKYPANGWYDDGDDWYFFQGGKKHTGYATDENGQRYFVNGKYANGRYGGKLYKEGLESDGNTYINGIFYSGDKYPANGWYDDGDDWYFFQGGKKHTGYATDENGEKYFVDGKYANGFYGGKSYLDGEEVDLADSDWYVTDGVWRVKNSGRSCHVNGDFIVISLSDQKLWLVRDGRIISKIGIVSGKPSSPTVTGNFRILSKEYSRILRGPGYASWVQYWMPFHGGYGIHDANWQPYSAFSNSNYYRWGGSHGCVNVHPGSMGSIYNNSYVGMRVIVY